VRVNLKTRKPLNAWACQYFTTEYRPEMDNENKAKIMGTVSYWVTYRIWRKNRPMEKLIKATVDGSLFCKQANDVETFKSIQ